MLHPCHVVPGGFLAQPLALQILTQ